MIKWIKLKKLIPSTIKIKNNCIYEIVWVTKFTNDAKQLGEARYDTKQILIHIKQSDREAVHSFFHELFHVVAYEYDINLTEIQVIKLESALYYLLKIFWLFK
jgi:choline kinase